MLPIYQHTSATTDYCSSVFIVILSLRKGDKSTKSSLCNTGGTLRCDDCPMKKCPKCMMWLELDAFARRRGPLGLSSYCKSCQSEYCKSHYRRNAAKHNRRRYFNQKNYRLRNARLLREYLADKACLDCGEKDLRVLEFDHVRGEKRANVTELCGAGVSWRRIAAEIAKCDIRCANCHRRKTVRERGWWRSVGA